MKIAQIATVGHPVRSDRTDSIELVVWNLTEQLICLGHDVTVFATADSETSGRLVSVLEGGYSRPNGPIDDWLACEWMNLCAAVERADEFDLLHSHAYLYGLPLTGLAGKPFVHTHHIPVEPNHYELARRYPEGHITALSRYQWQQHPDVPLLAVVPHGLDTNLLPFQPGGHDYLCFLGRLLGGKGPLPAIDVARKVGIPLVIAGPKTEYFEQKVQPLVDGDFIRYIGPVAGDAKVQLLGGALALIYPLKYPEPFGLVMIEAMLCGTPVAALGIGAVPEVVDQGVTGYYANDVDELVALTPQVFSLDRRLVRQRAEQRFSARRMAEAYGAAYARIV